MEWPKLKNIILIILIVTNLFLLGIVFSREAEENRQRTQARENAIQFLEDRGVQLSGDQVPQEMTLLPQTVERDMEGEPELAVRLLDGTVQTQDRGGEVHRYFNDNGSIQFHSDGALLGEFAPGFLPVGTDREKGCLEILARLDCEGELLEVDGDRLTFRQTWEGQPLFNQEATLELTDGCLTAVAAGRRLVGQPDRDLSRDTITVPTALFKFLEGVNALGDVCSRVDSITPGYVSGVSLSGPMTLTPTWHIVTDTGAYRMDLVTGVLSRLS